MSDPEAKRLQREALEHAQNAAERAQRVIDLREEIEKGTVTQAAYDITVALAREALAESEKASDAVTDYLNTTRD